MNSQLTVQYALICLDAFERAETPVLSPDLISRRGIPGDVCRDVLRKLSDAGILSEEHEGFRLVRPLDELTSLEVVQAVWAPSKKAPAFRLLYSSTAGLIPKTLEAISNVQTPGVFPGEIN